MKKRIMKGFLLVLCSVTILSLPQTAGADNSLWGIITDLTELSKTILSKIPTTEFSVLNDVLSQTDAGIMDNDGTENSKVWWSSGNREKAYLIWALTDWNSFDGLRVTLQQTPSIEAQLSSELKKYVNDMEAAAKKYDFMAYKELFKAIAQYRHGNGSADIFGMKAVMFQEEKDEAEGNESTEGSTDPEIAPDGGSDTEVYTAEESIEAAAKLFKDCLAAASYPDPSKPDGLKALLQAFEFEQPQYIQAYSNKYSIENAQEYASASCGGKMRSDADLISRYGLYRFRDQKFPDKVLRYYSVISIGNPNIPENEQQLLMEATASWPSSMDERRKAVIQKGLSLYGTITYSMDLRLEPYFMNPKYLDCSSFVGWSYYFGGLTDVYYGWATEGFLNGGVFHSISESELVPGDVGLINTVGSGGTNHIGIYIGKSASGANVWLHCAGGSLRRIVINTYNNFHIFMRYNGFVN